MGRPLGGGRLTQMTRSDGTTYWQFDYTDATRVERRRRLGSNKAAAQRKAAQLIRERDLSLAGGGPVAGLKLRWADVVEGHLAELAIDAKPDYVRRTRIGITQVLTESNLVTLGEIKPKAISAWRKRAVRTSAPKTVNDKVSRVRGFLKWCVREELLAVNPLAEIGTLKRRTTRKPRALSEREIARLLAAGQRLDSAYADYRAATKTITGGSKGRAFEEQDRRPPVPQSLTLRFLLKVGCRWGAAIQLTWADYSSEAALVTFREEIVKTELARQFPVDDELRLLLLDMRMAFHATNGRMPGPEDSILLAPGGGQRDKQGRNFRRWLFSALEAATIPRVDSQKRRLHTHALRHTWATRLMRAGVPIQHVQYLGGWKTTKMLEQIYTHMQAEDARDVVQANPLPLADPTGVSGNKPGPRLDGGHSPQASTERKSLGTQEVGSGSPSRIRTCDTAVNRPEDGSLDSESELRHKRAEGER